MTLKKILSLIFLLTIFFTASAFAKPFEGKNTGIGIFIGEVACYGEHEIRPEFLETFKEQLWQTLKDFEDKGKLHTVGDDYWIGGGNPSSEFVDVINVNAVLQDLHMDAIAYGPIRMGFYEFAFLPKRKCQCQNDFLRGTCFGRRLFLGRR